MDDRSIWLNLWWLGKLSVSNGKPKRMANWQQFVSREEIFYNIIQNCQNMMIKKKKTKLLVGFIIIFKSQYFLQIIDTPDYLWYGWAFITVLSLVNPVHDEETHKVTSSEISEPCELGKYQDPCHLD